MRIAPILPLLALAACAPPAQEETGNQVAPAEPAVVGSAQSAAEGQMIAEEQVKAVEAQGAAPAGAFQWTGRFAATRDLCRGGVWEFTNTGVETDGHTSCTIRQAGEGGGSVELRLACTAEGMKTDEKWTLTPAAGGGMRVSRRALGEGTVDVDLIRCG